MICTECGTRFEPMTDAYRCPECGEENYPPDDGEKVFTNCNVCGAQLRTRFEYEVGMCERCADD